MNFAHISGFDNETNSRTISGANKVVVNRASYQQRRDRRKVVVTIAVTQNQILCSGGNCVIDFLENLTDATG